MRIDRQVVDSHTARATSWALAGVLLAMLAFVSYVLLSTLETGAGSGPDCPAESSAAECLEDDR